MCNQQHGKFADVSEEHTTSIFRIIE
jgi:hypothetical protein